MPFEALRYTKGVVIVPGKSEYNLVRYIYTNLHLPIKIIRENRGSIQINGLKNFLDRSPFLTPKKFAEEYSVEYDKKTKKLKKFKLFIIMDTDDCCETAMNAYISGELFNGHPLNEYIVPIYNRTNLEDVMMRAGIMVKRIANSEKGTYYSKIFPINTGPVNADSINQIRTFAEKLKKVEETNMLELIEYCFEQLPDERLWK